MKIDLRFKRVTRRIRRQEKQKEEEQEQRFWDLLK